MAHPEGWGGFFYRKVPYLTSKHGHTRLGFDEGDAFLVERREDTLVRDFLDDIALTRDEETADLLLKALAPGHEKHLQEKWYGPYGLE